jgi:hypothetical protein
MASVTSVCNNAIIKVGGSTITSLDDNTVEAKTCKSLWDDVLDDTLRSHPWNCAQDRASLNKLTAAPIFGFDYQYQLPGNCLRVLTLNDYAIPYIRNGYVYSNSTPIKYKIEGRKLLTDESEAKIVYLYHVTDMNQIDPMLREVLAARMAAEIAFPIAKNTGLVKSLWDIYEAKLRLCRSIDGMEGTPDEFISDELGEVR